MRKFKRLFLLLICILSIFSCSKKDKLKELKDEKEEVTNVVIDNAQRIQAEEIIEEPLFFVSEGEFSPKMIYVEGGEFIMGDDSEKTNQPHPVKLSSFYMAQYLITTGEWKQFLEDVTLEYSWDWDDGDGYGPFYKTVPTDDCPAQGLNWYYAVIFCNWASKKDGLEPCYQIDKLPEHSKEEIEVKWNKKANGYRLATDAEWEYAARGGRLSKGYKYPGSNDPDDIGKWGKENKCSYPVGQYIPNELGIHDMGGNASEWCWDWYDEIMFEWLPVENPSVDYFGDVRKKSRYGYKLKVKRGATWNRGSREVSRRNAYPSKNISTAGIRLVRNVEYPKIQTMEHNP